MATTDERNFITACKMKRRRDNNSILVVFSKPCTLKYLDSVKWAVWNDGNWITPDEP